MLPWLWVIDKQWGILFLACARSCIERMIPPWLEQPSGRAGREKTLHSWVDECMAIPKKKTSSQPGYACP